MILTLTGKNSFSLQTRLKQLIAEFEKANSGNFGYEVLDGDEQEPIQILESLLALPFLGGNRLVVVRSASQSKDLVNLLEKNLSRLPESTMAVFVEPGLLKKDSLYKILVKQGQMEDYPPLKGSALSSWLKQYVDQKGGTIEPAALNYLLESSSNQQLLANEIDKLLAYEPTITLANSQLLVTQGVDANIFRLLDNLISQRPEVALRELRQLQKSKIEPVYIISMLAWQLNILMVSWAGKDKNPATVASDSGLSPFSLNKARQQVGRLNKVTLRSISSLLVDLDTSIKTKAIDQNAALEVGLLKLSRQL